MEKEKDLSELLEQEHSIELKRVMRLIRAEMKKGNTHISIHGSWDGDISVRIFNEAKEKKERSAGPSRNVTLPYRQRVLDSDANGNT